ncbi:MAG: hypothetical protein H0W02_17850 [Ktedonobacteraceae bacterium]|nr:hypothetical protein [Ktedonobacteraceae bacterium]
MRSKAWMPLWLFLLGATLGTGLDAIYVYTGIESYATPVFFGLAWWVPLLFGAAAVAIGVSHPRFDLLLQRGRRPPGLSDSLGALAWLLLAYLIGATSLQSLAKFGLLALVYFNFWLLTGRSWQNLALSIVTAITGTLIEMILVTAGAFSYRHTSPDMIGVPYWLPWLYACASLAVGGLGRSFMSLSLRGSS